MDAHYSIRVPQAFVASEAELKKLADLLSDRIGDVEIRADCADEVTRTFKNVKELAAFENVRDKELRRLYFSARSDDFKKRATIDLSGSWWWQGISLDFEARDDVVSRLRTEVLDIVAGMRPWYAVLHRIDFLSVSFVTYLLLWFGLLLAIALKWIPADGSKEQNPSGSALAQLIVCGGIAVLFGLAIALTRFRNSLFPRAVFLIGQGKPRFHHLERCQWGIVMGVTGRPLLGNP